MSFSTILFTEKGRALQAKASAGTPLIITKIKMGSGSLSGQSQITLVDLIEPKVVLNISEIKTSSNFATVKGIFKNSDISTGFYWREIGVFAQDPNNLGEILYCYGNAGALAEYIPPSSSEIIEKVVSLSIVIGDAANVSAVIDESLVFATKAELSEVNNKANTILNNTTIFETAGGTGSEITLKSVVLEDGYSKTFISSANNNGAATTINTKQLYKPGTTKAPNLVAGKAVTVWYDAAKDCFFIKASAEGTALAEHVLATYLFSNENDTGIIGTMPNNGAVVVTPGTTDKPITKGYHDGNGYVQGDADLISSNIKAGVNIFGVPGSQTVMDTSVGDAVAGDMLAGRKACVDGAVVTGNMYNRDYAWHAPVRAIGRQGGIYVVPPEGYYPGDSDYATHGGVDLQDVNFHNINIKEGVSMFGLVGTMSAGKKFASGTVRSSGDTKNFTYPDTSIGLKSYLTISGLGFTPRGVFIKHTTYNTYTVLFPMLLLNNCGQILLGEYSTTSRASFYTHTMVLTGNAYCNLGGFQLPVLISDSDYEWFAYE